MDPFGSTTELLACFEFDGSPYYGPIPLTDRRVAFSVKRRYPEDISYKPPTKANGEPDTIAVLWVIYTHPLEAREPVDLHRVSVRVRIAPMSQYLANHYDFDDRDPESPTPDSLKYSATGRKPIELTYEGEFVYDQYRGTFVDRARVPISGLAMLDRVFSGHCNTVHWLWGLRLRAKLAAQAGSAGALRSMAKGVAFILTRVFGRTLEPKDSIAVFFKGYPPSSLKKLSEDTLNLFGYHAAKSVVVLFATIVCAMTAMRYLGTSSGYVTYVSGNAVLVTLHGLLLLWILDVVVPWILFRTMKGLIRLATSIEMKNVKGP